MSAGRTQTTVMLGLAQTLSWASSYYLPAVLAAPMARAVGASYATVFAAFSLALLVSAAMGPVAGRLIDRLGGRPVLIASNLVFAAGLGLLSQATQTHEVFIAWAVMGLAMGSGLYEAAFATVVRLYGQDARRDHRHHTVRRFCQHRGLAAVELSRKRLGLARDLHGLGAAASAARTSAEPAAATRRLRGCHA